MALSNIRSDFPVLRNNPELVYLDSGATSLKPQSVVDEMMWFLTEGTSAAYRGVHQLGVESTERFTEARETIANWFGVSSDQLIFTSGTTAAINLVRYGLQDLKNVVTTNAEHHSNLLPWRQGLDCRVIDCDSSGRITGEILDAELNNMPADLVAISHVGNVLGAMQPIRELGEVARSHGSLMLVDAAQSAAHLDCDLDALGADFLVCSGHKMLGPSGIGALVAQPEALQRLGPVSWGGGMVESVKADVHELQQPPQRWEAGSPNVEAALGWAAAIDYLESLERPNLHRHLQTITAAAQEQLSNVSGVELLGECSPAGQNGILPIKIDGWEAHAAARVLSQRFNICVRSGFHCAQPLHQALDWAPTLRASFHVYTTLDDIERFTTAVETLTKLKVG